MELSLENKSTPLSRPLGDDDDRKNALLSPGYEFHASYGTLTGTKRWIWTDILKAKVGAFCVNVKDPLVLLLKNYPNIHCYQFLFPFLLWSIVSTGCWLYSNVLEVLSELFGFFAETFII